MTPREKALELREKCDGYVCYAEVVVDEILKALELAEITSMDGDWGKLEWQEVKQELEKL